MRFALLQCPPPPSDPEKGLDQIARAARSAASAGADILVTPEMAVTGYAIGPDPVAQLAQPSDGRYFEAIAGMCRALGIGVVHGYPERDGEAVYNAAQLVDRSGMALINYRKTHLFGTTDRSQFSAGQALSPVVEFAGAKVALGICYDVEFPELARDAALGGAEILIVPTANMEPYRVVSEALVPARAYENGINVAYANFVGAEADFTYSGLTCLVGPSGADVVRAGARGASLLIADMVAPEGLDGMHMADRRTDLYGLAAG